MTQTRITLLCSSFPPETGAAPGRMYQLAKMLRANGYKVDVICAMPNYPAGKIFKAYKGKMFHKEKLEGIDVSRIWLIPTNSSNKAKRIVSLLTYSFSLVSVGLWQLIKSKPQIVIISSPPFATGYIGTLLAKFTKAITVLNVSDLWPKTAFDLGFFKQGKLYHFLLRREQEMYRRAAAFSVQSQEIKTHVLASQKDKPVFIYRNLQPHITLATLDRPQGKRKIVYAGLLGIAQGVFEIIKAINFKGLQTEFHIYGQGNELEKIKTWINQHPGQSVYYHGFVPADKIPEILAQYHIMLIPLITNIDGAVPSKIFNAFANGLPILFSGNGEAAEIVQRTNTGFVNNAADYIGLSNNISKMLELRDAAYNDLRNNCLQSSANEFNKAKQDDAFVSFLKEIIK